MTCKGLYKPQHAVPVWTEIRDGASIVQQGHDMLKKAIAAYCDFLTVQSQQGGLTSRLKVQKQIKKLQPESGPSIPLTSLFGQSTNREREKAQKQAWQNSKTLQKSIWTHAQLHYGKMQNTQIELMFAERLQRLVNRAREVSIKDK